VSPSDKTTPGVPRTAPYLAKRGHCPAAGNQDPMRGYSPRGLFEAHGKPAQQGLLLTLMEVTGARTRRSLRRRGCGNPVGRRGEASKEWRGGAKRR
jgi:hypothetical protein